MKVVSITQSKNESSILPHWLDVVGDLVDEMIIFDDNSEDNSIDIIKNHKNFGKIHLLSRHNQNRSEGMMFRICHEYAKYLNADRIYISDVDEIPSKKGINNFEYILRERREAIKLQRMELALDQSTCYCESTATGKLVIVDTNKANFSSSFLHSSQPNVLSDVVFIKDFNNISLTHYGPSCYSSQVLKCLSYIIWENKKYQKPFSLGYKEYFKTYKNFVRTGEYSSKEYKWESSPSPYFKFCYNEDIKNFCMNIDVFSEFDINKTIEDFRKIKDSNLIFDRIG